VPVVGCYTPVPLVLLPLVVVQGAAVLVLVMMSTVVVPCMRTAVVVTGAVMGRVPLPQHCLMTQQHLTQLCVKDRVRRASNDQQEMLWCTQCQQALEVLHSTCPAAVSRPTHRVRSLLSNAGHMCLDATRSSHAQGLGHLMATMP
jgi:hypothetical protein